MVTVEKVFRTKDVLTMTTGSKSITVTQSQIELRSIRKQTSFTLENDRYLNKKKDQ